MANIHIFQYDVFSGKIRLQEFNHELHQQKKGKFRHCHHQWKCQEFSLEPKEIPASHTVQSTSLIFTVGSIIILETNAKVINIKQMVWNDMLTR